MINDTIDFELTISKIIQQQNTNLYLQANVLNSEHINKSFQEIENTLNVLYEKTRYLEDAITYTKEFLETKINYFDTQINAVLHEIENVAESSKNLSYISYNVPFVQNTDIDNDRNRGTIRPLSIKDGKYLTLSPVKNEIIKFSTCERTSESIPYKDNFDVIKTLGKIEKNKDEAYRTLYLEERLISGGLTETITMYFKEPTTLNTLDISVSNCEIKNLKFGLVNGSEEYVGDYDINLPKKDRTCTYIKFDLVCTNYELIIYEINKSAYNSEDIWSNIRDFTYNTNASTEAANKFDTSVIISKFNATKNDKKVYVNAKVETKPMNVYSYIFGINSLTINNVEYYTDGYMISDPIIIGNLKEGEYIRLDVKHNKYDTNEISYSILDEDKEVPIAILEEGLIENELLFGEALGTRFGRDFDTGPSYTPEVIKQDGMIVDISYEDAQLKAIENKNRYSITYKTDMDYYDYKPLHDTIRIKCYIRSMKNNAENVPYISSITIKKYGEDSLWTNRY